MKTEFMILVNGIELLFRIPGTKRAAVNHIKRYLVSTHMGEWTRHGSRHGWTYSTTIGRYYSFIKTKGE